MKPSELTKIDDQISEMCFSFSLASPPSYLGARVLILRGGNSPETYFGFPFFSFFFSLSRKRNVLFFIDRFFEGK